MARIIVIGAGVTGLTTALQLQSKGHNVTIVAKWFPGESSIEYTSPWAGAHWRTMAPNSDKRLQEFDAVAYRKFMQLAKTRGQETGVVIVPSSDYYEEETPDTVDPWFKDVVLDFRFVPKKELPLNAKVGHRYTTVVINAPYYIRWLLSEFQKAGGQIKRQTLNHISDVFDLNADAIVNCTGLGAKTLGGVQDDNMFPTRGQTLIVKGPTIRETTTYVGKGFITYVIPRSDGTVILGGTAQKNKSDAKPDEATAQDIHRRVRALAPHIMEKLEPLEIVGQGVGLRPTRAKGVRIENQVYTQNGKRILVTHAYGHGGFGYQSSWGSAEYVTRLVERGFREKAKL